MTKPKTTRTSRPGLRTRRQKESLLEVIQAPQPSRTSIGTATTYTYDILEGGPDQFLNAQNEAQRLADNFGHEFEAQWCLPTPWLTQLANEDDVALGNPPQDDSESPGSDIQTPQDDGKTPGTDIKTPQDDVETPLDDGKTGKLATLPTRPRLKPGRGGRTLALYALQWRPTFLAVVALTRSVILGARAAKVSPTTINRQRGLDPDFDRQIIAAQAHAVQLLHDVTFRDALEGVLEPVLWQGIPVAWVRKYDNRLRIELLRAHLPNTFQTPGRQNTPQSPVNIEQAIICTPDVARIIQEARLANLKALQVGTPEAEVVPTADPFS